MINSFSITLDVDWAPDFAIERVRQILKKANRRSTWFVTHDSPSIKEIVACKKEIDAGIHPNFLQGTTQGDSPTKIMNNLKRIVPGAVAVRSHAMVYSAAIARMFSMMGMSIDSSVYLGGMANIQPFVTNYAYSCQIIRMPYFWSDDAEMVGNPLWEKPTCPGLKILCFHPIHIYLNTARWEDYVAFKSEYNQFPFIEVAAKYINKRKKGTRDYLECLLNDKNRMPTLMEIAQEWTERC